MNNRTSKIQNNSKIIPRIKKSNLIFRFFSPPPLLKKVHVRTIGIHHNSPSRHSHRLRDTTLDVDDWIEFSVWKSVNKEKNKKGGKKYTVRKPIYIPRYAQNQKRLLSTYYQTTNRRFSADNIKFSIPLEKYYIIT